MTFYIASFAFSSEKKKKHVMLLQAEVNVVILVLCLFLDSIQKTHVFIHKLYSSKGKKEDNFTAQKDFLQKLYLRFIALIYFLLARKKILLYRAFQVKNFIWYIFCEDSLTYHIITPPMEYAIQSELRNPNYLLVRRKIGRLSFFGEQ